MGREDEIRIIAYALWVQDGYNHKHAIQHWLRAEAIWEKNRQGGNVTTDEEPVEVFTAEPVNNLHKPNFSHTECDRVVAPI